MRHFPLPSAILLIIYLNLSANCPGGNFVCSDKEILNSAETARINSAIFWTGKPLPADWYLPCPIQIVPANHSGGGMTQFRFEQGEVHSWSMQIEGRKEILIRDVIPHEVDHAVRATLVRHPIERWLDEGCASLFESPEVHQHLRTIASQTEAELIQSNWLNNLEYPDESEEIETLYAVGFSLVEYLLTLQDADTLLELQRQTGPIENRFQKLYSFSVPELREGWRTWKTSNAAARQTLKCECLNRRKPLLVIWTAKWCSSCREFEQAWRSDADFRSQIEQRYHVHVLNYDQYRGLAFNHGIANLPTFEIQNKKVVGYTSSATLLAQLMINQDDIPDSIPETELTGELPPPTQEPLSPSVEETAEQSPIQSKTVSQPKPTNESKGIRKRLKTILPTGLTLLQWAGIFGTTAATGGIAGLAFALLPKLLSLRNRKTGKKRLLQKKSNQPESRLDLKDERSPVHPPSPFPRKLDEARQLLELRETEGRVAVLDALRGMFLEDEIEKLKAAKDSNTTKTLDELLSAVDQRVDQVAPLSTKVT